MTTSLDTTSEWNFRVFEKRLVIVKAKNEDARRFSALDVLTNVPFAVEVPPSISLQELIVGKEYLVDLRVYTSKNMQGVDSDFLGFFEALDIDQGIEDFIKAYWVYPNKIRFQLENAEQP